MRYLLDTHILIWAITGDSRADSIRDELTNSLNEVCYSSVSIWEIAIKHSIGKLVISPSEAIEYANKQRFTELPLEAAHAASIIEVKYSEELALHKDPFDRILIAQAKMEGMTLVTADKKMANYSESCINLI